MGEYWKRNKWTMLITSVVILLPILVGIFVWDTLPTELPYHWNVRGEVDNWVSRGTAVFLMPCVLLAFQWLCFLLSALDPKQKNVKDKPLRMVLWIIPVLNILLNVIVYLTALGQELDVAALLSLFMGALFVVIGNYLPKCRQSYTMGIKLPWTLHDEENWNATHRMAGKLWLGGGLLTMACALLPPVAMTIVMLTILVVMVAVPTVYSYRFYKKKQDK
ncbi:MAG: SdpI family protein [Clostridia bacterium]|nr:SdpI family protein [Clostridia bacterium]